jgi:hypothetical protein
MGPTGAVQAEHLGRYGGRRPDFLHLRQEHASIGPSWQGRKRN